MKGETKITLNFMEIHDLKEYVRKSNETRRYPQLFLEFREDYLVGIKVEFLAPRQMVISHNLRDRICNAITKMSNDLLHPVNNNQIWSGILDINYTTFHTCNYGQDIIKALNFIVEDLMDIIAGKKTLH